MTGLLLPLLLLRPAEARRDTYCVGGYTGTPGNITATACDTPAIRASHRRWHHHNFFLKDGVCYDCWDEHDTSCQISFARQHPEYKTVRAPQCGQQDTSEELIAHVITGLPAEESAWDPSGPVDARAARSPTGRPPTADEPITLVGTATDHNGASVPARGHFEITTDSGPPRTVAGARQADGTVTATVPLPAGAVSIRFVPELPVQPPEIRDHGLSLQVRPQLSLPALPPIDFGTVPAGTPPPETCQDIDLSAAILPEGVAWTVSATGLAGCAAQPILQHNDAVALLGDGPAQLPLSTAGLTVCLQAPWCDSDSAGAETALRLVPADPRYPDISAEVPLRWSVIGRSWLACNGFWLWPAVGGLALLFGLIGVMRPHRFPAGATVRMAGSEKGLKRAAPTRLLDVPGSAAGFYRDARLGMHAEGSLSRDTRRAVLVLRAVRGGVRIDPRGPIERLERRNRAWVPAVPEAGRIEHGPRDIFRIGDLYFQLEAD